MPPSWTVSFSEISAEARRRGLGCFITTKPNDDGNWLVETASGYAILYLERGLRRTIHGEFSHLEQAFEAWLELEMRFHLLPIFR
ncbi:hypothetical protein EGU54_03240 [Achromobacter aegrifaciens]|nr:hypothetical protein EGU54_03240 [Achromobacter aegrifaciens]